MEFFTIAEDDIYIVFTALIGFCAVLWSVRHAIGMVKA